jgi:branched-chain amino acid transport system substrate-binding protein
MRKNWIRGIVAAASMVLATSAFAQTLKVGVAGPFTGPNAAFGAQLQKGAEQAAADMNAAGGIMGMQIELLFGDDVSDPKQGVSVANKFVGDGVKFVLGHFNSGVTMPASEVYRENGMLAITPSATNVCVTDRKNGPCGNWTEAAPDLMMFRTCGRDDQQGAVAGKYIVEQLKGKVVAVVHDKTPYGQGLADATKGYINTNGVTEAIYEGVSTGDKDFSALISKMKAANVEIVYWGGLHTEAGLIVRQMRDQGMNAVMMSGDGITSNEFASIGGPGVEGTLMTFPPDPRKRPEAAEVVKRFTDAGFDPESYTLYTYAALEILKAAIEKAGAADPAKVAEVMYSGDAFKTVIGDIAFDKKGDITRPDYVLYTWKKNAEGKITYTTE